MIEVAVERGTDGRVTTLRVTGHADFADHGYDIVCAGVSALVETAALGLRRVAKVPHRARTRSGDAEIRLMAGAGLDASGQAQAILETTVLGLKDIANTYPQYVHVGDAPRGERRAP